MPNKAFRRLRRPYPVFALALLALTLALWAYLWTGLASYEAGIPKNLMQQLVRAMEAEALEEGTCAKTLETYGSDLSQETIRENGLALADLIRDKELSQRKIAPWKGPGELAYHILADGKEVALAVLETDPRKGILGLARYRVANVQGTLDLTVMASPGVQVYAGETLLTREDRSEEGQVPQDLRKWADSAQNQLKIPRYDVYLLKGLFQMPRIRGVDPSKRTVDGVFSAPDRVVVGLPLDPALMEEVGERAVAITHKYSNYMSDDLAWSGFKGYLVDTAPVYDRLRTLEVNWYTLHDSYRFENMEISGWIQYSEQLISLRTTYDYVIVGQGKVTTYKTDLTYYLALEPDGKWRVAEMIVN